MRTPLSLALLGAVLLPVLSPSSAVLHASSSPSTKLLLPYFAVDTTDPDGETTLWAVRNDSSEPLTLTVTYYETGRLTPQVQPPETFELGPKQVLTKNIRFEADGFHVNELDGFARGWVTFESSAGGLIGDFFRIVPNEAFASGDRLVDIDPASPDNESCSNWAIRFLNGGAFSGGSILTIWLDRESVPTGEEAVLSYVVYDEPGDIVLANSLSADELSFQVPVSELMVGPLSVDFGALEIQFADGGAGHVSTVMDALGLFSVGMTATCRD